MHSVKTVGMADSTTNIEKYCIERRLMNVNILNNSGVVISLSLKSWWHCLNSKKNSIYQMKTSSHRTRDNIIYPKMTHNSFCYMLQHIFSFFLCILDCANLMCFYNFAEASPTRYCDFPIYVGCGTQGAHSAAVIFTPVFPFLSFS